MKTQKNKPFSPTSIPRSELEPPFSLKSFLHDSNSNTQYIKMFCLSFRSHRNQVAATGAITTSADDDDFRLRRGRLVAVLGHVDDHRLFPAEQEVPEGGTEHHGQAEPRVVRHEDQHQQEAQRDLEDVQERLEQVHHRQHRGWLLVDHFADHVHNARPVVTSLATAADSVASAAAATTSLAISPARRRQPIVVRNGPIPGALLADRNGPVLERVVRPPEQVLPVVLEALVERGHDEDEQHRPEQTREAVDFPLLEQDRFVIATVERHRHHVVDHPVHSAVAGMHRRRRGRRVVHRVILQAVLHRAVMAGVVVMSSGASVRHVRRHVLAVVVMLRMVHIGLLLLLFRWVGQHALVFTAPVLSRWLGRNVPFHGSKPNVALNLLPFLVH